MAGAWLWCGLLALASVVLAVPPKIISSTVTIKDAEAAGARVSLAQYNTIVDQDIHVLQMQDCPSLTACPPIDACAPCNYANKTECERIVNPVGQPDQACLETCDPSYCDVDTYGDWEEIALPKTSLIADLGDYDTWPNGVARYRFYIPQGQPYCNMSAFLRASGQGEFSSAPDLMATRVPLESDYDVYNYDRFPWLGGRLYDDQFYICPTDIYPLYTDSYSAGTYFVYVWYSEGACNLTLEMQPIPGPSTEVEDMSWCDATLSTLPPPFQGKTAELLTDGVINATSTVHKCIASDTTYNYVLQDQFRHRLLARVDGPCPRYFGITQVDEQTLVGRNLYLSLTTSAHVTFDDDPPGEIIMEQDFSIRSIFLTFCPANVSEPTYVSAYIQGDGLFRVFYSKNRNRFSAKLLTDFGDEITQVATMSNAVMLAFPDSASVPFCTKLCLYSDDPCSCQDGIESVLARQEVSPLYPLPSWYSVKTALYSPPMPDWLAPSPFVGLRSIPISLLIKSEATIVDRTVPIPLFTEDQIDTSYVFFMGRLSLVNAQLEGFNIDVFHPDNGLAVSRFNSQNCTVASYTSIKGDIDYWVSQLTNTSVSLSLVTYELDALSFREPYVACKNKASSLLRSVAVTRLQDSAGCIVFDLNDPCCADNPEWEVCCVSRPQNVTSVSTSPADDALIGAACPYTSPSCLRTYLSEYTLAEQASCGDVLPVSNKWRFTQCVDDWVDCSDEVFGEQLIGEECVTDADCPSGFCNAPYTPSISLDPLRVLSNPRGPRRVCQEPLRNLTSRFLRCLAQSGSAVFLQVLRAYPAPSLNESIDLMIANLTTRDCVAPAGVALEAGYYQHYGDGEPPCVSACEYQTMGPFIRSTNNCNQGNVATLCGSNYQWNIERDLSECPLRSTCNWYDCVNNHLSNADCNATCLAPSSGVCAICRNDGTCFDDFSTYDASVTDDISCGLSSGCQLANGTIVNLSPAACAATFSCSNPCWDSVAGAYRPCLSEDECMQAGKCSDDNLDNPLYPDDGGSCVFQPRPFYGAICAGSYSEYTYVNSDNVGCIVYDLDKAECLAADRDPQWFPLARTREECEGRCGCLKDTTFFSNWRVDKMISTFPSTPEQCSECAPAQKCEPYHTWTPARWEAGSPRTLKWVTPGLVPAYELRSDAFDWATFVSQWSRTCSFDGPLWRARTLTYNQCRFNRVASSLEAVACGCGTDGSTACSDAVVSSLPIGVGEPCPLVPQTLNIPPHTIEFYATSVPATQGCTSIVAFLVSESAFANSAPSQRLSSYFAPKPQDPKAGEFTNSHSAVVGEVIGDGVLFQFNGTFSSARLCLDVGAFSKVYATLRVDEFPLLDIAYSVGGVVTPLNLVMDIVSDGYCGTIDTLKEGVYVPVIHKYDWENVRQKGLTRGEKSVLALSAALYFVSVAIYPPYYCIQFVRSVGLLGAISVSLFWLPILLAAANILRGVYFALLAAELLSDQTYVDVLLVELPTFIWFTASSLMVLFWLVFLASIWNENSVPRIRRLKRAFWITFFVVNGVMYGLFIAFVVVFSQLKDRIDEEQCLGRLPPHVLRRPKRIAFIVYQSVLAAIALFLAIAHVIAGPLLSRRLHRAAIDKRANSAAYFKLVVVAVIVAIAFALHAIFIFALALTNPGIPYLVLILLVLDLVPTAILLWQLPTPAVISNTSSTSSSGTVGNVGGSGPSSMSASLF